MSSFLIDLYICIDPKYGKKWISDSFVAPITSVVPSTTSTALTTLWTGRTPAEHGIIGYEMWLKEYGIVANMIAQGAALYSGDIGGLVKAKFSPDRFLELPTFGSYLKERGINTTAFQPLPIAYSGLSLMLMKVVQIISYRSLSDLFVTLLEFLEKNTSQKEYIYVYWDGLDSHLHHFGPCDERVYLEFEHLSYLLELFFFLILLTKIRIHF